MRLSGLLILATIALVLAAVLSAPFVVHVIQLRQFYAELDQIHEIVETWREPPPGADPDQWENRWGTLSTAIANLCYSPSYVPQRELEQLTKDLRQKDREPDAWQKTDWLWQRLAETGPYGKRYISGWQSAWDDTSAASANR